MAGPVARLLRPIAEALQRLRLRFGGSRPPGVHGIAVTPAGKVVLVRLRYAPGWRFPGGGRGTNEDPAAAVLRELREEIGLERHGDVQCVADLAGPPARRGAAGLFLIRDAEYRPHWSLEVEQVIEADPDRPPGGTTAGTLRWLALVRPFLDAGPSSTA